ncbi:MAG: hypothetical protein ACYCS7_03955, partial [Acidimicrobiales bacterium]
MKQETKIGPASTDAEIDLARERMVGRWRQAGDFIDLVREAQAETGKSMRGRRRAFDDVRDRISIFERMDPLYRDFLVASPEICEAGRTLLDRFEGVARRRGMPLDAEHYAHIYRTLLCHLMTDSTLLEMSPTQVVPATLVNRTSVGSILADPEFDTLRDTPGYVRTAISGRPTDPRGYLRRILETERSVLEDPEFESLRSTPGLVRHLISTHPNDPRAFLRKILETERSVLEDPEFESLR